MLYAYTNSVGTHAKGYLCPHGQSQSREKKNIITFFFFSFFSSFLFRYGQLFVLAAGDDDGDRREWAKVAKNL